MLDPVIHALDKGEFKVRKEAVWVITNYTSGGTTKQIYKLLERNVLEPLCKMLAVQDIKSVNVALDAVNNILLVSSFTNIQVTSVTTLRKENWAELLRELVF